MAGEVGPTTKQENSGSDITLSVEDEVDAPGPQANDSGPSAYLS